jgi:starch synthase
VKLLFAASEIAPHVKTGGLGDVAAALPPALARAGCDTVVLLPAYPALRAAAGPLREVASLPTPGGELPAAVVLDAGALAGAPTWLVDAPGLYDRPGNPYLGPDGRDWHDNALRFGLLSRVASWLGSPESPLAWRPDVLHCNDWQTGLAPAFLRYLYAGQGAATVLTVHNLAFLGLFDRALVPALGLPWHAFAFDGVEFHGWLSFLKAGLQCCDRIATVSPTYADEILRPESGCGLDGLLRHRRAHLAGILNGIDTEAWNPAADPALARPYDDRRLAPKAANKRALQQQLGLDVDEGAPLLGAISRLTEQKGLDLLLPVADDLLAGGAQLALLGSGDREMERAFEALAARHPGRAACRIGFDEALAHRIEAGADVFLMPSRFEPCGLNQMYSLRYGTPPVVRRTGGLADTVVDVDEDALRGNGFLFDEPSPEALRAAIARAIAWRERPAEWRRIQRNGMRGDYGWSGAAARYLAIYGEIAEGRAAGR